MKRLLASIVLGASSGALVVAISPNALGVAILVGLVVAALGLVGRFFSRWESHG